MKRSSSFHLWLMAVILFSFSCGSNETKTEESTGDSTAPASTTPATTAPASTITTEPVTTMVSMHKVKDFDAWFAGYEAGDSMRLANGLHNYVIGRGTKDPSMVLVSVKVDDLAKAKAFSKGASLKQAMQKSGVIGTPTFTFVNLVFRDTGDISTKLRTRTSITVKDWDKWQKSFDSTRQVPTDNGLAIRGYGYDPDNNHKVTIVSGILDSTKAAAYWNSDMLK